jgi:HipA-like protein
MLKFIADWLGGVKAPAPESQLSFRIRLDDLEVGELTRDRAEWVFRYSDAFRAQNSVKPIMDFPQVDKEYRSAELWPFFLLRIPSPAQPVVQRHLANKQIAEVDEGTVLREFGRWSVANPFELQPA